MLVPQVLASAGASASCNVSRLKKIRNIYFCCGAVGIVDCLGHTFRDIIQKWRHPSVHAVSVDNGIVCIHFLQSTDDGKKPQRWQFYISLRSLNMAMSSDWETMAGQLVIVFIKVDQMLWGSGFVTLTALSMATSCIMVAMKL